MPADDGLVVTIYTPGLAWPLRRLAQFWFVRLELITSRLDRLDTDVDVSDLKIHGRYEIDTSDPRNDGESFRVAPGVVREGCASAKNL